MPSPQPPPKVSARPIVPVAPSASGVLVRRFAVPAVMVVVGVLLTLGDGAYAAANGEVFTLGPFRLAWLATGLVIAGIGLAVYRLLFDGAE